jgi:3-phosphoshikimate 1-carboxyvinyltransferase
LTLSVSPVAALRGRLRAPSDKSLTHRSYMFAAIANSPSIVTDPLRGEDCESTLRCLAAMGLRFEWISPTQVKLTPAKQWSSPKANLDCGNSGTTMRLMSGLIASRSIEATLTGDDSLSRRPMKRIADPLRLMGATIDGEKPPLHIVGHALRAIDYVSPVASAQIKSCVLLAGLRADGVTSVREPSLSRDHTERMLLACGVKIETTLADGFVHRLRGGQEVNGFEISVPADISSAAFFMVAAAILPDGGLTLQDLSVNPTRTGILDVFRQCGIGVEEIDSRVQLGEPVAELDIRPARDLRPFSIGGALVPRLIDEIPVLAVLATQCGGTSVIRDARELRVKESDRIELVAEGLRRMGATVETFEDGMEIKGPCRLRSAKIDARGDHRIAMAFAVAGLVAEGQTEIEGADSIATSYPGFERDLESLAIV